MTLLERLGNISLDTRIHSPQTRCERRERGGAATMTQPRTRLGKMRMSLVHANGRTVYEVVSALWREWPEDPDEVVGFVRLMAELLMQNETWFIQDAFGHYEAIGEIVTTHELWDWENPDIPLVLATSLLEGK